MPQDFRRHLEKTPPGRTCHFKQSGNTLHLVEAAVHYSSPWPHPRSPAGRWTARQEREKWTCTRQPCSFLRSHLSLPLGFWASPPGSPVVPLPWASQSAHFPFFRVATLLWVSPINPGPSAACSGGGSVERLLARTTGDGAQGCQQQRPCAAFAGAAAQGE